MKKKKPGFTLIEMVIVVALTTIVLGITSSMFITGNRVFSDSDNKTTLQMEARDIQEELTNIGMQGIGVTDIKIGNSNKDGEGKAYVNEKYVDLVSKAVNEVQIQAYDESSEYSKDASGNDAITNLKTYNIVFNNTTRTLSAGSRTLSTHVKSFNVIPKNTNDSFTNASSIEFNIVLESQKGFSNVPDYPVKVDVIFRNKGD